MVDRSTGTDRSFRPSFVVHSKICISDIFDIAEVFLLTLKYQIFLRFITIEIVEKIVKGFGLLKFLRLNC